MQAKEVASLNPRQPWNRQYGRRVQFEQNRATTSEGRHGRHLPRVILQPGDDLLDSIIEHAMICRASGVQFQVAGHHAPTIVPWCGCTVSKAAAEAFVECQTCGICNAPMRTNGTDPNGARAHTALHPSKIVLQLMMDMNREDRPALAEAQVYRGSTCNLYQLQDQDHSKWTAMVPMST